MTDFGTGETTPRMSARAVRRRLLNPIGGVSSSEIEILNSPQHRRCVMRSAMAAAKKKQEAEFAAKVDAAYQRLLEEKEAQEIADTLGLSTGNEAPIIPVIPTVNAIIVAVSEFYKINLVDMISQRRVAHFVRARHVAMYLAKRLTARSLPDIGRRMGGRDHTTILHGIRKIAARIEHEPGLTDEIAQLCRVLNVASPCVDRLRGEG